MAYAFDNGAFQLNAFELDTPVAGVVHLAANIASSPTAAADSVVLRSMSAAIVAEAALSGLLNPTYQQYVNLDGAAHYWRLNEASGTVAVDSIAASRSDGTYAAAGNTLHGSGGPSPTGGYLSIDATTASTPGVNTNLTTSLSAGEITLEILVRPAASQSDANPTVMAQCEYYANQMYNFPFALRVGATNVPFFEISRGLSYAVTTTITAPSALPSGVMSHLAAVYRPNGLCEIIVNGVQVASATIAYAAASAVGIPWTIGCSTETGAGIGAAAFAGDLAEAAIYTKALLPIQLKSHYEAISRIENPITTTGTMSATESGSDSAAVAMAVAVSGSMSALESGSDTASFSGLVDTGAVGQRLAAAPAAQAQATADMGLVKPLSSAGVSAALLTADMSKSSMLAASAGASASVLSAAVAASYQLEAGMVAASTASATISNLNWVDLGASPASTSSATASMLRGIRLGVDAQGQTSFAAYPGLNYRVSVGLESASSMTGGLQLDRPLQAAAVASADLSASAVRGLELGAQAVAQALADVGVISYQFHISAAMAAEAGMSASLQLFSSTPGDRRYFIGKGVHSADYGVVESVAHVPFVSTAVSVQPDDGNFVSVPAE